MLRKSTCAVVTALAGLAALYPATAHGWSEKSGISATVNKHEFDQIEIESEGCSVRVALYFTAPEAGYSDKKNTVRNYYRFRARIDLAGRSFKSGIFSNDKTGRRRIRYVHDTSSEGCWAKQTQKLRGVHVEGCRNRNCKVPAVD
jgi:hypothetical protein